MVRADDGTDALLAQEAAAQDVLNPLDVGDAETTSAAPRAKRAYTRRMNPLLMERNRLAQNLPHAVTGLDGAKQHVQELTERYVRTSARVGELTNTLIPNAIADGEPADTMYAELMRLPVELPILEAAITRARQNVANRQMHLDQLHGQINALTVRMAAPEFADLAVAVDDARDAFARVVRTYLSRARDVHNLASHAVTHADVNLAAERFDGERNVRTLLADLLAALGINDVRALPQVQNFKLSSAHPTTVEDV